MTFDSDLVALQEVRNLLGDAHRAQKIFEEFSQEQVDRVVDAMASAAERETEAVARLAVDETGMGVYEDKVVKTRFAAKDVYEFIRPMKTVGIIDEDTERRVLRIAQPMGVVAAIIPTTNPTSTAIYKVLIAAKSRNGIVVSPHPRARRCIYRTVEILAEAAYAAGAPRGLIGCLESPTIDSTQHLMSHDLTGVILATGGAGLVKAAYSSGKPAYGVGPGNVPSYIDRTADVAQATRDIVTGTAFDNGTICASEQSAVVDAPVEHEAVRGFEAAGGYFVTDEEKARLEAVVCAPGGGVNSTVVGQSATKIAEMAGIDVPAGTRVLLARLQKVCKKDEPLSIEKLSPILGFYVVKDWVDGCQRCVELLELGGMGHTLSIHADDAGIIREFGLKKPAFRICVNTPSTHGSIGFSTNLAPAMTLGCGAPGGNITGDNITPMHLLNIKRLAWGVRPVELTSRASEGGLGHRELPRQTRRNEAVIPPDKHTGHTLSEQDIQRIVDGFLAKRRQRV